MTATGPATRTAYRICPLCEAGCGLEVTVAGDRVTRIRGDRDDVFSHGYICPKGSTLKQLHEDPDRVRHPMVKRDGEWQQVSWDEAFAEIERRLLPIVETHGRDAVAAYIGNPNAHTLSGQLYGRAVLRALGTRNLYSASTVDQRPKELSCGWVFGNPLTCPVPDIDRTDWLLILGANPFESNGSFATAPDWPGRIEALRQRGGKLVVVDPRRSRTAEAADEHHPIRPGTDPFLLMAIAHTLFDEGLVRLGAVDGLVAGVDDLARICRPFSPEAVAEATGIDAATTRRLARELATADRAVVYGRIGTTTAEFGTLTSWLVDVCNILSGHLDQPGGAMFTKAAAGASNTRGTPGVGRGIRVGRWASRVRGLPETFGELPAVCLAEEIETPGDGQVRALVTIAGNPVLSTPNSARLDAALETLDFMVSVDIYLNETTRHADVFLPGNSPLTRGHYDIALLQLAIRNVAHYSPPVFDLGPDELDECAVLSRLALVIQGAGASADPALVDDALIASMVQHAVSDETSVLHGRDADEVLAALGARRGPERLLDLMVRTGPYGEGFGADPAGLSLDVLADRPHGVDLGPLEPRMPEALRTPDGMIHLAPEPLVADVPRLAEALGRHRNGGFLLVGRRHLRSNNSWMHNIEVLVKGKPRCTLQMHTDDAARLGLDDGDQAQVASRTGKLTATVEVTDGIMRGVVSLPHGWGHDGPGVELSVARRHAGVNSNLLADEDLFDPLSGTAVLNGIPVTVTRG